MELCNGRGTSTMNKWSRGNIYFHSNETSFSTQLHSSGSGHKTTSSVLIRSLFVALHEP